MCVLTLNLRNDIMFNPVKSVCIALNLRTANYLV